jgi:hypothetical protein
MALEENEYGRNTGTLNGYKIGPKAKLKGADLSGADLRNVDLDGADLEGAILIGVDFTDAFLADANLKSADLTGANLTDAYLSSAKLQSAILTDAILVKAYFGGANLNNANLTNADLTDSKLEAKLHNAILENANLTNATLFGAELHNANLVNANLYGVNVAFANFSDADLTGANWANIRGLHQIRSFEGTIFPTPASRLARSYGAMTGPILKLGKSDSPAKASEFKRRYPAEFERLKGDTSGRDFTENMKESLREKYATPFDWVITKQIYDSNLQRFSPDPNRVIVLNVDTRDYRFTDEQRALFAGLDNALREKGHPRENPPLFTIGWVRYAQDDKHRVLLIEEVQSDAGAVESKVKKSEEERTLLRRNGIGSTKYESLFSMLRPYSDRLYEDAIGLVFQEAEALGYTVEMLSYDDKKIASRNPLRSAYIDLPKRMGLSQKRYSQLPMERPYYSTEQGYVEYPPNPVHYYKPNPGKPSREANAPAVNERSVNRALAKAGVPVVIVSRNGYKSLESTDPDGPADIDSIYVPYWGDWTLEEWVQEATENYQKALRRWE